MSKVLVTGASGFIGKNLCAMLDRDETVEVLRYTRADSSKLEEMVIEADFIFHLAGVNRPNDELEFDTGNRELTETIINHLKKHNRKTPFLLTSSSQAELDTSYGVSKKAAEDIALSWSEEYASPIYIYRLPGVFGKWCKPDYNSVVATFCNNIAQDKDITVNDPTKVLTLVYIDDVVTEFISILRGNVSSSKDNFYDVKPHFSISLGDLATKLKTIKENREKLLVPNFEQEFDRDLYATFTSYFDRNQIGYPLDTRRDERGWLAEFIKSEQFGQIYISRTNPGFTRGIHWHNTKIEKFLVIEGTAEIKLRPLDSDEITTFEVTGRELRVMEMPAGYVHSIKNIGENDMLLLIWSQEVFNPDKPDTYQQEV
ncbi:SDR family oxidoreductase [Candidatus Saccharibacteria bacterium]|nr:MAG: SDR family oxidoreductase [Candidatus Saccharibacteria bacterium]